MQTTDAGRDKLYRVDVSRHGDEAGAPQLVVGEHNNTAFALSRDGRTIAWVRDATQFPAEVYVGRRRRRARRSRRARVTHENDALVAQLA